MITAICIGALFLTPISSVQGATSNTNNKNNSNTLPAYAFTGTLDENEEVNSFLNATLNTAMYRYEVKADSSVEAELAVSTTLDNVKIRIMNSKTETLLEEAVKKDKASVTGVWEKKLCLDPGMYYIYVMYTGKSYGSFKVTSKTMKLYNHDLTPDDTLETARKVAVNTYYVGSLSWKEEMDLYYFEIPQGGVINVALDHYLPSCKFELLDSLGNVLEKQDLKWTDKVEAGALELKTALKKGKYYVRISNTKKDTSGKYTFALRYTPVTVAESEPNNDILHANAMQIGTSKKAMMTAKDKIDLFKIQVPSERRITFIVNSNMENFQWGLYDRQYKILRSQSVTGTPKTEDKPAVGGKMTVTYNLKPGTYYVQVSSEKTGIYTVKVANMAKPQKSAVTKLSRKKTTTTGWNATTASYSLEIKCKKISNVAGYEIETATDKNFKNKGVATTTEPTAMFKVDPSKRYYVRVRTYKTDSDGKKVYSGYSPVKSYVIKK